MSDKSHKPLPVPKIRTFAGDLAVQRNKRDGDKSKEKKVDTAPVKNKEPVEKKKEVPKKIIPVPKINKPKEVTVEKKEGEKVEPKKMPAFHELQSKINKIENDSKKTTVKKVDPIKVTKDKPKLVHKKVKRPKKINLGYDATIITDNKHTRQDFFPALVDSISKWFQTLLTPKPKSTPKYTIAETSTRKGVIQKATTKSGSIFTADNESLKERIRKRQIEEANKPVEHEPETSWSPYTETGYDLLEAPDEEIFDEEDQTETEMVIPSVPLATNQPLPDPEIEVEPPNVEPNQDEKRWAAARAQAKTSPEKKQRAPERAAKSNLPVRSNTPAPVINNVSLERRKSHKQESYEEDRKQKKSEELQKKKQKVDYTNTLEGVDTNTMSILILMVVIGLVSVLLVGRIIFNYVQVSLDTEVVGVRTEAILSDSIQTDIIFDSSNPSTLPALIDEARSNNLVEVSEFVIVDQAGNELSPSSIFDLLNLSMIPTMKQSIDQVRFISLDQREEMIVFKFTNEESVRGGFLNWEPRMAEELGPVIASGIRNGDFTDDQLAEQDVRQLISPAGQSITYLIVDNNTAVISGRTDDLERLINLEFNN